MDRSGSDAKSWWLDEVGHAGVEHLDPAYVAAYDAKSPTDWEGDIATLKSHGIGSSSTVIDIGAGTGSFAIDLLPHVARVVAVDVSEAMVAAMRRQGIEAVPGGFLSFEYTGGLADAVFSRNALHHLPDFWKAVALDRVAGLLAPGGVLILKDIVYAFDPSDAGAKLMAWFGDAPKDATQGWTTAELAEHVREEHSTFTWLLEPILEHCGFGIEDRHVSANGIYAAYTCIRR